MANKKRKIEVTSVKGWEGDDEVKVKKGKIRTYKVKRRKVER